MLFDLYSAGASAHVAARAFRT
jgi:hypothetical protein